MDDENASCAHDCEEDAQLSLLDLPVEVRMKKKRRERRRLVPHPREILFFFSFNRRCHFVFNSRLSVEQGVSNSDGQLSLRPAVPISFRPASVCPAVLRLIPASCCVSDIPAHMLLPGGVDVGTRLEPGVQAVLPDPEGRLTVESANQPPVAGRQLPDPASRLAQN